MAEGQFVKNDDGSWSQQVTQTGSKLKWNPLTIFNSAPGMSKTIVVPTGKEYKLDHVTLTYTTTAVAGNRSPGFVIDTGVSSEIIYTRPLPAIAASLSRVAEFGIGYPKDTAFDTSTVAFLPLAPITLKAGERIVLVDNAAVDPSNDTVKYLIRVLERSV